MQSIALFANLPVLRTFVEITNSNTCTSMKSVLRLYRDIRRLHRKLPEEMKYLGNQYVISEFRLHRNASPEYVVGFTKAWNEYLKILESQAGSQSNSGEVIGRKMGQNLDDLKPEQIQQLYELKNSVDAIK